MMTEPTATNGSRFTATFKWRTAVVGMLLIVIVILTWLVWTNLKVWEWARESQSGISKRVAEDRVVSALNNARMLNELKLQTLNQVLPVSDQQRMLPMLLSRLDDDTKKAVLSLRLRALMGTGEQEAQTLRPQRPQGSESQ
jgi:hypothetical protein